MLLLVQYPQKFQLSINNFLLVYFSHPAYQYGDFSSILLTAYKTMKPYLKNFVPATHTIFLCHISQQRKYTKINNCFSYQTNKLYIFQCTVLLKMLMTARNHFTRRYERFYYIYYNLLTFLLHNTGTLSLSYNQILSSIHTITKHSQSTQILPLHLQNPAPPLSHLYYHHNHFSITILPLSFRIFTSTWLQQPNHMSKQSNVWEHTASFRSVPYGVR